MIPLNESSLPLPPMAVAPGPLSRLTCRAVLTLPPAGGIAAVPGHEAASFEIDPRAGEIGFCVDHLGLFTSRGRFRRFNGRLAIDFARPERSRVTFELDANSVEMAWPAGAEMFRSAAYFDVISHPSIRFSSSAVTRIGESYYLVHGTAELRGLAQSLTLQARIAGRLWDPQLHAEMAELVLSGELRRSDFGMTADQALISDRVEIRIRLRIPLPAAAVPEE
jgi:polyisoprenoid-binding protein YceI